MHLRFIGRVYTRKRTVPTSPELRCGPVVAKQRTVRILCTGTGPFNSAPLYAWAANNTKSDYGNSGPLQRFCDSVRAKAALETPTQHRSGVALAKKLSVYRSFTPIIQVFHVQPPCNGDVSCIIQAASTQKYRLFDAQEEPLHLVAEVVAPVQMSHLPPSIVPVLVLGQAQGGCLHPTRWDVVA